MTTINIPKPLFIFVHGFLGDDSTFQSFPEHLNAYLPDIEIIRYPTFATRGLYKKSVKDFSEWLVDYVMRRQENEGRKERKVVFLAHSMGGLVCVDSLKRLARKGYVKGLEELEHSDEDTEQEDINEDEDLKEDLKEESGYQENLKEPIPNAGLDSSNEDNEDGQGSCTKNEKENGQAAMVNSEHFKPSSILTVIGIMAYDTPFFHLNSDLFSLTSLTRTVAPRLTTLVKAVSIAPRWAKIAFGAGAVIASVTAGDKLMSWSKTVISEHAQFLEPLLKEDMDTRSRRLEKLIIDMNVKFRCFYVRIPPLTAFTPNPYRTFINIPTPFPEILEPYFTPIPSTVDHPVEAHTHMFDSFSNEPNYMSLLDASVHELKRWLNDAKRVELNELEDSMETLEI